MSDLVFTAIASSSMGRESNNLRLIMQEFKGKDVTFTFIKVGFLQVAGIIS